MADNADIAADLMERRMQAALSSRLSLHIPNPDPECEDCGHEIPPSPPRCPALGSHVHRMPKHPRTTGALWPLTALRAASLLGKPPCCARTRSFSSTSTAVGAPSTA